MKILLFAALALVGAAVAGVVAQAGATKTTTVRVTEREYKITLSTPALHPGLVKFQIKNTGTTAHAFAIAGKGVKARTKTIKPGQSAVLSANVKAGPYAVWCPMPGHAAKGMKATIAVTAVTQAGGAGAATTSGGAGGGDTTTTDAGVPWG
jgi:plastocyanin